MSASKRPNGTLNGTPWRGNNAPRATTTGRPEHAAIESNALGANEHIRGRLTSFEQHFDRLHAHTAVHPGNLGAFTSDHSHVAVSTTDPGTLLRPGGPFSYDTVVTLPRAASMPGRTVRIYRAETTPTGKAVTVVPSSSIDMSTTPPQRNYEPINGVGGSLPTPPGGLSLPGPYDSMVLLSDGRGWIRVG